MKGGIAMTGKFTTKEILDSYFESLGKTDEYIKKIRAQVDRPEVYEYEQKLGKQIFEMNVDELFEMLLSFNGNRTLKSAGYSVTYASWTQITSRLRDVFNFYIDNYEVIRNPFNDKRMRGTAAYTRLSENKDSFTTDTMEKIIEDLKHDFALDRAMYFECLIRMAYDGFANAREMTSMKENMIDFQFKTVTLPGRIIQLSNRTSYLLTLIHDSTTIENQRGDFLLEDWHGSYFKFIVRKKSYGDLQTKDLVDVANILNRMIVVNVKNKYGVDCNLRTFYLLGLYDRMVSRFGKEKTNDMITSIRDSSLANELVNFARLDGVVFGNVTLLKKSLRPFVS